MGCPLEGWLSPFDSDLSDQQPERNFITMKKFILALALTLSIMIGCSTAPQKLENDWMASRPGTIFITGNLSETDFQSFYNQTTYGLPEYRIILNTNGGEAMACVGIMQRIMELQRQGVKITTEVYSKAYSAGAFIFMMGDTRIMHESSTLMWHTMIGQMTHDYREFPSSPKSKLFDTKEMMVGLDEWVFERTKMVMPNVDPMTLETMLLYSGMTFLMAETANELGMVDELVRY